VKKENH
jgi:hypothetical protein